MNLLHHESMRVQHVEHSQKLFEILVHLQVFTFRNQDLKCDWGVVKNVFILVLQLRFQIGNEIVFASQLPVSLKMVDQIPRSYHSFHYLLLVWKTAFPLRYRRTLDFVETVLVERTFRRQFLEISFDWAWWPFEMHLQRRLRPFILVIGLHDPRECRLVNRLSCLLLLWGRLLIIILVETLTRFRKYVRSAQKFGGVLPIVVTLGLSHYTLYKVGIVAGDYSVLKHGAWILLGGGYRPSFHFGGEVDEVSLHFLVCLASIQYLISSRDD